MDQLSLEGGGPCPMSRPKPLELIVVFDRFREPEVEKAWDRFPEELYETDPPKSPLPF